MVGFQKRRKLAFHSLQQPYWLIGFRTEATSSGGVCGNSRDNQGHPAKWSRPSGLSWASQMRVHASLFSAEVSPASLALSGLVRSGPGFLHTDLSPEAALSQHHSWRSFAFIWQSRGKSIAISDDTVQAYISDFNNCKYLCYIHVCSVYRVLLYGFCVRFHLKI